MKTFLLVFIMLTSITVARSQNAGELLNRANALDNAVQNGLKEADNILSDQQRALFVNLTNYTSYLMSKLQYLSNDLDRKLTQKEIALLNDLNMLSYKLSTDIDDVEKLLKEVTVIFENSVSRLPGTDRSPTPTFYEIPLITTSQNKIINMTIKGVRVNNSKNYILFKDKKIPVTSVSSINEISFYIPLTETDIFNPDTINIFKVFLFKNRLIGKDKVYEYTPKFVVVPKYIGKVRVYYKVNYIERETKEETASHSATSGSNDEREVNRTYHLVNPGWTIDRSSIKCWKRSGNGDEHGASGPLQQSITEISFVAKAWATDGRAVCQCTWVEYKDVNKTRIETKEELIHFNEQKIISLPDNLQNLQKTEITYFDKSSFATTDSYFKNNYIEFRFKQLEKVVDIKFIEH